MSSPPLPESLQPFVWEPPPAEAAQTGSPAERFMRLGCLIYGDWHPRLVPKAQQLLDEQPELVRTSIHAAATAGDVAAVQALLAEDPALANAKGGPLNWEPLLYACYSRIDDAAGRSTLEAARLLLAAGADPNAGFLWGGNVPPFTALTGAYGEGEDGINQPPHRHRDELARLLLDAGADPNDGQTLYNRHFKPSDDHLKLLLSYGLGHDKQGPWFQRLGDRLESPARMLIEELWAAARKDFRERVALLVEHGVDVNTPGRRDGRTPLQAALLAGNQEIAAYLLEHGAKKVELSPREAFAAAGMAGRRDEARALLDAHPGLLESFTAADRVKLIQHAVEAVRPEGIRFLAELGFPLSNTIQHDGVGMSLEATPLHNAAWMGNLEIVKLLIELGADPNVRDRSYNATAAGWAEHNGQMHVVEYLGTLTR